VTLLRYAKPAQASASQRTGQGQAKRARHAGSFAKAHDGRKQAIRGL